MSHLESLLAQAKALDEERRFHLAELAKVQAERDALSVELAKLRAAAPVMLTVLAYLADEAHLGDLRQVAVLYGEQHADHLETWLDAEKARVKP
jgi:hypothetical protein